MEDQQSAACRCPLWRAVELRADDAVRARPLENVGMLRSSRCRYTACPLPQQSICHQRQQYHILVAWRGWLDMTQRSC